MLTTGAVSGSVSRIRCAEIILSRTGGGVSFIGGNGEGRGLKGILPPFGIRTAGGRIRGCGSRRGVISCAGVSIGKTESGLKLCVTRRISGGTRTCPRRTRRQRRWRGATFLLLAGVGIALLTRGFGEPTTIRRRFRRRGFRVGVVERASCTVSCGRQGEATTRARFIRFC